MIKRLKKIAPLQLGKVLAITYGLLSLVMVPFFLLFSAVASLAPTAQSGPGMIPMMLGMGIGFLIIAPVLYAVMGFVTGVIGAFVYNLVAGWVGGIEVEVE
ncbi:MAG: hypothetical protein JF599_11305 [Verrucomicrobia bacterium]|nr:hypothetical protein [Verrucomicrobiota bacterium]